LLVEHSPVYTVGRRIKATEEQEKVRDLGADFHYSQRGGQITFHGPGQLVGYPILHLKQFQLGARCYVDRMEETIIQLLKDLQIDGKRTENTGIWVRNEKICAIGIHIQRFVTSHGFGLNCNTDLTWFDHITPCGLPLGVTSLSKELKTNISITDTIPLLLNSFSRVFKGQVVHLSQLDKELDQEIDQFLHK
jgi:lipoyl(octanoyl) transferase